MEPALLNSLRDVLVVVDAQTLVVESINREHPQTVWGRRPESLLGARLDAWLVGVPRAAWREAVGGAPVAAQFKRVDGGLQPVEVVLDAGPAQAGGALLVVALREASERARTEERVARAALEAAPVGVLGVGRDRAVVTGNAAAARLCGVTPEALPGKDVTQWVPEAERAAFVAQLQRVWAGETVEPGAVVRLLGGHGVDVQETLVLVRDAAGEPVRVVVLWEDRRALGALRQVNARLEEKRDRVAQLLGLGMDAAWDAARRAMAQDERPVLILGEAGAGKGALARFIHSHGPRADQPLLELHCTARTSAAALEAELFGQEQGRGACQRGLLELAGQGSVLLHDVGMLPPALQARLLQYLDEGTYRRAFGNRVLRGTARVMATNARELGTAVAQGRFKADLAARLGGITASIPPLRARLAHMPQLAAQLLAELARVQGSSAEVCLEPDAVDLLCRHDWPGNVAELKTVLERALLLKPRGPLAARDIPLEVVASRHAEVFAAGTLQPSPV